MNFKRSAPLAAGVLASLVWRLCCPSPFCHGNSADDIVFLGWVWYRVFTHTQPLKEMSAGLYRRWWQTPWRVPPKRCREINEFLKDALSAAFSPCVPPSSSNILWTCFSSYHLLSCGFLPLPPTSRSLLPPLPSSWQHFYLPCFKSECPFDFHMTTIKQSSWNRLYFDDNHIWFE